MMREVASLEVIQRLADMAPAPEKPSPPSTRSGPSGAATRFDVPDFLRQHGVGFKEKAWKNNATLYVLDACPFNAEHNQGEVSVCQQANGALSFRCFHNTCTGDWYALRDLLDPGWRDRQQQHTPPPGDKDAPDPGKRASGGNGHANGNGTSQSRTPAPKVVPHGGKGMNALLDEEIDPLHCVVEGLLPEGLTLFCGKAKVRKSFMGYQLAIGVALGRPVLGNCAVDQGDVLMLALEDGWRRLQDRGRMLLAGAPAPANLTIYNEWPRADRGGLSGLDQWLTEHPKARLVVIDVLAAFRAPAVRGLVSIYEQEYNALVEVKRIADKHHVAILILHHSGKAIREDAFDAASGTTALTGAADTCWVLQKKRGDNQAILSITGRDVAEREVIVQWDANVGGWVLAGAVEEARARDHADAEERAWTAACAAWWEEFRSKPISSGMLLPLLQGKGLLRHLWEGRDALGSAQTLGRTLGVLKGREFGTYEIEYAGKSSETNNATYRVINLTTETPETPETTELSTKPHMGATVVLFSPPETTVGAEPDLSTDPVVSGVSVVSVVTNEGDPTPPVASGEGPIPEPFVFGVPASAFVAGDAPPDDGWRTFRETLFARAKLRGYPEVAVDQRIVVGEKPWRRFSERADVKYLRIAEAALDAGAGRPVDDT